MNSGYDKIENNFTVHALRDLTGAPAFEYLVQDDGVEEQILDALYQNYVLTAHKSTEESKTNNHNVIDNHHTFAIIDYTQKVIGKEE